MLSTEGEFSHYLRIFFTQPSNQVRPPLAPPLHIGPIPGDGEEKKEFPGRPVTAQGSALPVRAHARSVST